jgi:hypothetical protein
VSLSLQVVSCGIFDLKLESPRGIPTHKRVHTCTDMQLDLDAIRGECPSLGIAENSLGTLVKAETSQTLCNDKQESRTSREGASAVARAERSPRTWWRLLSHPPTSQALLAIACSYNIHRSSFKCGACNLTFYVDHDPRAQLVSERRSVNLAFRIEKTGVSLSFTLPVQTT